MHDRLGIKRPALGCDGIGWLRGWLNYWLLAVWAELNGGSVTGRREWRSDVDGDYCTIGRYWARAEGLGMGEERVVTAWVVRSTNLGDSWLRLCGCMCSSCDCFSSSSRLRDEGQRPFGFSGLDLARERRLTTGLLSAL